MDTFNESLGLKIPGHVAVILDGNGRWAKKRHLPRTVGHVQGSKVVEDMLYVVDELGVKYFTVYAFSTENWKRSTEEVSTLMGILRTYLKDCVKKSMKNNVRCRVIGRKDELSQDIIDSINNLEEKTKRAEILVAAIGKAKFITADMVAEGAVVIDVGMNRDENGKLCGDVDFESVKDKCSYITPVPGGVGPMTIAMLMKNTLTAAKLQNNIK